jgi:hypothetical protein
MTESATDLGRAEGRLLLADSERPRSCGNIDSMLTAATHLWLKAKK